MKGFNYTEEQETIVDFTKKELEKEIKAPIIVYIIGDFLMVDIATGTDSTWRNITKDVTKRIHEDKDFCMKDHVQRIINEFRLYVLNKYFN